MLKNALIFVKYFSLQLRQRMQHPVPFWRQLLTIGCRYVALMSPAKTTFVRYIPPAIDGRKKNRGKEKRTRWSLAVKAAAIESYMEAKEDNSRTSVLSQDSFCMNYKFDQGTFSKWLAKSDQIIKAAGGTFITDSIQGKTQ